ncbi:SDR family NAD(P)-dependent oxidoreductase [Crenalkalicoccus roseus]|uniref:SDR family NAD(P)-dependent oxidoreductase n=1 Tax=Crenalkalicoccus roseus TaxID=1485588 RepID=UPI00108141FC|nr:SDR family oxidoreductase [Crenalkalicoccus roseus]
MIRCDLKGRAALVTGAASGIGLATATMLAENGCRVAVNHLPEDARGPEQVAALRARGLDAIGVAGNVGVAGECEAMVEKAIADLGRLDFLVNNAGTPGTSTTIPPAELGRITDELWRAVIDVNLLGVFRCTKAAAPALKAAGGAVVSVASIAGLDSPGSSMAYGATKAGVISLTKNLARALAPEVRVNAVAPGAVDSSWMIRWTEEQRASSIDKALLRRRCRPEDLAEVILFLLAGAAMVTGQTIVVDGGLTLGR